MALSWTGTPSFTTQGQILSASAHLNTLAKATGQIFDRLVGFQMPFSGIPRRPGTHYYYIRHKANTFHVKVTYCRDLKIYYGNNLIVNLSSASEASYEQDINIASLGAAVGNYYEIRIESTQPSGGNAAYVYVWTMYEKVTQTLPTLASFGNGTVPAVVDWANISTTLEYLHALTSLPVPAVRASKWDAPEGALWIGSLIHRGGKLYYKIETVRNMTPRGSGYRYDNSAIVYINESPVLNLYNRGSGPGEKVMFEDSLDLSSLGLPVGQEYTIRVSATEAYEGDPSGGNGVSVFAMHELPMETPSVPSYNPAMPTWKHPDVVTSNVQTIRNNLTALSSVLGSYNYPTPMTSEFTDENEKCKLRLVRKHRWLHYAYFGDYWTMPDIKLKWKSGDVHLNGEPVMNECSLEEAHYRFNTFDLSSQDGLWQGIEYTIEGAHFALEDHYA